MAIVSAGSLTKIRSQLERILQCRKHSGDPGGGDARGGIDVSAGIELSLDDDGGNTCWATSIGPIVVLSKPAVGVGASRPWAGGQRDFR